MSTQTQHLLDVFEAADVLRMIPSRVTRLAKAGVIPAVRLPDRELRFVWDDLWEWALSHRDEKNEAAQPTTNKKNDLAASLHEHG